MQTKRNLVLLGCFLGLFETISQVVLIRELLIAFTGNELTIATVLALWLISVSAGCIVAGRSPRPRSVYTGVATLFIIAGLFSLLQVILIRLARPMAARSKPSSSRSCWRKTGPWLQGGHFQTRAPR